MSYADALQRLKKLSDTPGTEVPKVPKPPYGTFGTAQPGTSGNFRPSVSFGASQSKALTRPPSDGKKYSKPPVVGSAISDKRIVPIVRCRDCQHFQPDPINPPAGLGECTINAAGDRLPWPSLPRRCRQFTITPAALLAICRTECDGSDVDPAELAAWLHAQDDPDWCRPTAVRRWAELIGQRGGFPND